ncbi:MAG TPA: hypothetical protein PLO24_09230 [Bacteroidales bacterium]|jgi:hypothetical protein|nr:hypothetical protein [Bacteroidales bacterium]HOS73018.1 hypothetical protein [Bacteroidales bacterium]HQH25709.1 hypothetical protein [Bacteroidales bacterium]HQJ83397.1 hypothetical protein [Bacteroidales bacterium]
MKNIRQGVLDVLGVMGVQGAQGVQGLQDCGYVKLCELSDLGGFYFVFDLIS